MKCISCRYQGMEEGLGRCPKCGFPVLKVPEDEKLRKMAKDYLLQKFQGIRVGVVSYGYEREGMELVLKEELLTPFTEDFLSLPAGEITWQEQLYRPIPKDREISLTIYIERNGERRRKEVLLKTLEVSGPWQVGIRPEEGLSFSIAAGGRDFYAVSEPVFVI